MADRNSISTLFVDIQARTSGLAKSFDGLSKKLGPRMSIAGKKMAKVFVKSFTVGVGAGLGAGTFLTKLALDKAEEIERLSQMANESAESFQRMAFASRTVGVEQYKLADILKDTQDKIGDFMQTGGGAMADFFENIAPKVGVTREEFKKLSGGQALQLYYDSLAKANLSQAEMTFYMEAIASDATLLVPLLRNAGQGFAELGAKAVVMSQESINTLNDISDAFTKLKDLAINQWGQMIAETLVGLSSIDLSEFNGMMTDLSNAFVKVANVALKGGGKMLDIVHGLKFAYKGLELYIVGFASLLAKVYASLENYLRKYVQSSINLINKLIEGFNKIPMLGDIEKISIDLTENSFFGTVSEGLSERFNEIKDDLATLIDEGLPSAKIEAFMEKVKKAGDGVITKMKEVKKSVESVGGGSTGKESPLEKQANLWEDLSNRVGDFGDNVQKQVEASITDLNSLGDIIGNIGDIIKKELINQLILSPIRNFIGGLVGSFFGGLGSAFGSFGGARAQGGNVMSGRTYLVGERGPELFSPGSNGRIHSNGSFGGGGGGNTIIVDMKNAMVSKDAMNELSRIVDQLNRSVEPRAISAVANMRQRSGGYLSK